MSEISVELIRRDGDKVDTEPFDYPETLLTTYEVFAQVPHAGKSTFDLELERTFTSYVEANAFRNGLIAMLEFLAAYSAANAAEMPEMPKYLWHLYKANS